MLENDAILGGPPSDEMPDGIYRYVLQRVVSEFGGDLLWVMVNPSKADAHVDDATVRKVIGFTRMWGFGRFRIVNLFAIRSTDVRLLKTSQLDIVGPKNDQYILESADWADTIMVAWGDKKKIPKSHEKRPDRVLDVLMWANKPIECIGTTKSGSPLHPLMPSYKSERRRFV